MQEDDGATSDQITSLTDVMATIQRSSWEEVHSGWPMVIVQQLGKLLPPQYVAGPRVHLGSNAEVDVASFELQGKSSTIGARVDSGSAITTWAPSEPSLLMETELCDVDEYEVRVYDASRNRRLVAAIELISPANKDRPESRNQFVAMCAASLRQHVSVVLVDIVSSRAFQSIRGVVGANRPTRSCTRQCSADHLRMCRPVASAGRYSCSGNLESRTVTGPTATYFATLAKRRMRSPA